MADSSYMVAPGETTDSLAMRRKLALALAQKNMQPLNIEHWTQGLAHLADSAYNAYDINRLERQDREETAKGNEMLARLLAPQTATSSAPATTQPMGRLPSMGSRVYDQNEFNPLDAAVATPTELGAGVPAPKQYASLIGKAAVDNDLPPQLLAAQLKQESGFNPNAVSPAGASGISQFMPGTARDMGVSDPFNPQQAIPAGAQYLRQNIDRFGGSVPLGLAAYNAGPGRVEKAGGDISRLPAETQGYVSNITGAASTPAAAPSGGVDRAALVQMLGNRKTAPMAQGIIQKQIAEQLTPKTTDEIREYEYAQKNSAFKDYKTDLKRAGAIQNQVVIDQKGETAFNTEAGKVQAKRFDEIAGEGPKAKQMVSDVETLRMLGDQIRTGKVAEAKAAIGPYADALGVKVDGLNEIQAFEAIVNRVAPNMRVPGSGAQSDYELRNFLKSMPTLGNTPEGNALIARTMEGVYQNKVAAAEIASRALNGDIKRPEAERMLRELPDPMKEWRENFKKSKSTAQPTVDDLLKKYGPK